MITVSELVGYALEHGNLYGARPGRASKTLSVNGKRRYRIRLQMDIFGQFHAAGQVTPYYPDLTDEITEAIAAWRRTRSNVQVLSR